MHRPSELVFTFRLLLFSQLFSSIQFLPRIFVLLDKAGVFVGSSAVVPPVFPFFSPCLTCPSVVVVVVVFGEGVCVCVCACFFLPSSSSPLSSSAFITSSFLLRMCVYTCLFC